ncbi:Hypp7257 [Branchiostoma lanceolatum]|uniref:Hypp7257 protein n=1 Tax=Branchiostoma lanceolatum TaxID=7740 RepID=A0A8J9YYY0_BRALA|nr:Hypp7257 [Branchiostoma lanceolatum]
MKRGFPVVEFVPIDTTSNLLGSPPVISEQDTPINLVYETLALEYGDDGITPEFLKYAGIDDVVLSFINKAFSTEEISESWRALIIVPVPKSGDLRHPDNYRGVSLISLVLGLYNRMLLNRLRPALNPLLRNPQNGFRQRRSTVDQIVAIRRLLKGVTSNNLSCIMTFIDFKKAFDTIHRGKLMSILRAYGVPGKLATAIAATNLQTWAKVRTPDGDTDTFQILAGVLQGDTLAPFLFIVALGYASDASSREGKSN